jgi:hypothetical protein
MAQWRADSRLQDTARFMLDKLTFTALQDVAALECLFRTCVSDLNEAGNHEKSSGRAEKACFAAGANRREKVPQ